jgi:kumamolisin
VDTAECAPASASSANQHLGKPLGWLHPILYGPPAGHGGFNDIVNGNNGAYAAGPGWDACSGWGSPNGTKLLQALAG